MFIYLTAETDDLAEALALLEDIDETTTRSELSPQATNTYPISEPIPPTEVTPIGEVQQSPQYDPDQVYLKGIQTIEIGIFYK